MSKKTITKKQCTKCLKEKTIKTEFYLAANDIINADGRLSICKSCLEEVANIEDMNYFIDICRMIDRPFIKSEYDASIEGSKNPFGEYFRRLAMRQNREKTYLDSEFDSSIQGKTAKSSADMNINRPVTDFMEFDITPETRLKWGENYSEQDLYQLESFYKSMTSANSITTPQHIEQLKLLCLLNLEQNKALREGKVAEFQKLNTQYNKILENSGFRPIDKRSGGESVGIRTFSQVWEEIERDGFIEPYMIEERQDIVDKTILYTSNYTRSLLNMGSLSKPPEDTPKVDEGVSQDEL